MTPSINLQDYSFSKTIVLFVISVFITSCSLIKHSAKQIKGDETLKIHQLTLTLNLLENWKIEKKSKNKYLIFAEDNNQTKWTILLLSEKTKEPISSSKQYYEQATQDSTSIYYSEWVREKHIDIFDAVTVLKSYVYEDQVGEDHRLSEDYYFLKNNYGYFLSFTCTGNDDLGTRFDSKKSIFKDLLKTAIFEYSNQAPEP